MTIRSVLISQGELKNYLQKFFRGFHTKDYELFAALLFARFHQNEFKKEYMIGIPIKLKNEKQTSIERTPENIERILKSYVYEDTPVDIFIVPVDELVYPVVSKVPRANGKAFQLKKFDYGGDITNRLADYINDIAKKNSIEKLTLLLMLGGKNGGTFDVNAIAPRLILPRYPFERIMFITGDYQDILFGEFWPYPGSKKYRIEEIL